MTNKIITQEQFNNTLIKMLEELSAASILDIPGIYEILSEYFNNEVINIINDSND